MNSGFFNGSTNTDWPFVYKISSTPEDGALSQNAHVYVIHVLKKYLGQKLPSLEQLQMAIGMS